MANDNELVFDKNKVLIGGPVRKLLELLTNVYFRGLFFLPLFHSLICSDSVYITDFLNIYKFFTTPAEVLDYVIRFYHKGAASQSGKSAGEYELFKRQRVLLIAVKWIEYHPEDFKSDKPLRQKLQDLVHSIGEFSAIATYEKVLLLLLTLHY